jgi:hypothetical protein
VPDLFVGVEMDNWSSLHIEAYFSSLQSQSIAAMCIVMNSSINRITSAVLYELKRVISVPKSGETNYKVNQSD